MLPSEKKPLLIHSIQLMYSPKRHEPDTVIKVGGEEVEGGGKGRGGGGKGGRLRHL
jgi:hypothetical protein